MARKERICVPVTGIGVLVVLVEGLLFFVESSELLSLVGLGSLVLPLVVGRVTGALFTGGLLLATESVFLRLLGGILLSGDEFGFWVGDGVGWAGNCCLSPFFSSDRKLLEFWGGLELSI